MSPRAAPEHSFYAWWMRFRSWSSLVQAASVVTAVALGLGLLAVIADAQADDLSSSMGAGGVMTLSLMTLTGAFALWITIGISRLVLKCRHRRVPDDVTP